MDHLSEQIIRQHLDRKLSSKELLAVDEHLASCDQCHLLWSKHRIDMPDIAAVRDHLFDSGITEDDHLTYEALEALVDGAASDVDREIAQVHLEACSRCTAELRGLEELRDQETPLLRRQSRATTSWLFSWATWPRLAIAAAATLAVVALGWFVWKSQRTSFTTRTQVATSSPSPLTVSSPIPTPSVIPSPEILVSLRDAGGTITLDSTGKISGLRELSPTVNDAIKRTLTTQQLNIGPALAGLKGRSGTLMGRKNEGIPFRLLSPVGLVVQSDRPTFRWESYKGATVYVVKVYDPNFKELASSLSQTATSWTVPVVLPRGTVLTWQVTAIRQGEEIKSPSAPAPPARFRVLAKDRLDEIRRLQSTTPTSHLALGTAYAEAGLLDDARREFRMLLKVNPESKVAQKLLQEVNSR